MQFSQIFTVAAFAASASALAVRGGNSCGNAIAICKDKSGSCSKEDPQPCTATGGEAYCCSTVGLVNALDCVSLLNGNTITVPISISIL